MDLAYLKEKLTSKLSDMGYDLYSLRAYAEKGERYLEVKVDRVGWISINEISKVTEVISPYMDEIYDTNEPYNLIISSAGAEKEIALEKLNSYLGYYMEVRCINPINGENILFGYLKSVNEDSINLQIQIKSRKKEINIAISNISKIKLAIKF